MTRFRTPMLMDFFYVWLRRTVTGLLSPEIHSAFASFLTLLDRSGITKANDGELIDDCE